MYYILVVFYYSMDKNILFPILLPILFPIFFFICYILVISRYKLYNSIIDKIVLIGLVLYYSVLDVRYGLIACFTAILYTISTANSSTNNAIPKFSLPLFEKFEINRLFETDTNDINYNDSINDVPLSNILTDTTMINTTDSIPKEIWLYWHDDIYYAPDIVRYCVDIVKKLNPNYTVHVLNQYSINTVVKDKRVLRHLNNPNLKEMHKSDLLRMYLISTYGGIYIDSSIVLFDSFDWIYKLPSYDLLMYKANIHTTNNHKPVLENWFIAAKPNNDLIRETLNMLLDIFDDNMYVRFNILKNDRTVDYQKFKDHDIYHLTYFCLIYVQQKFNIKNNNYYIDCNPTIFPFNVLYGNQHTLDKLYNAPISEKTFNIYKSKHMLKLASYNRKYIEQRKLYPKPDSFMERLNRYIQKLSV